MAFTLTQSAYQGPLDKLLELIEREQLTVTQVSLAKVTADFLEYVRELEVEHGIGSEGGTSNPQLVADFLVVASKLILIKSKALLPSLEVTPEEAEEMQDLEARLKLYQELRGAQRHLKELWNPIPTMFAREFLQAAEVGFYPPPSVTPAILASTLAHMMGELERLWKPTASIRVEFANLQKKIEEVLTRLTTSATTHFSKLSGTSHRSPEAHRSELVVLFLAILHLIREQMIQVDQGKHFDDMRIAKLAPPPIQ